MFTGKNFTAHEDLPEFCLVAAAGQYKIKKAAAGDAVLGICLKAAGAGEAVSFCGLDAGQCLPVIAGETITAGDILGAGATAGKVFKVSTSGVQSLGIVAQSAGVADGAVMVTKAELGETGEAVYAQKIGTTTSHPAVGAGDKLIYVNSSGQIAASATSRGDTSTPVYLDNGQIKACESVGGASFDVGSDGLIPVGSYGLVAFFSSGSMAWTVNAGETATVTSVHVARVPQLSTIAGTGSGACFFQQTAGQTDYPAGTTFTALTTIICAANNGNALALVKRTA